MRPPLVRHLVGDNVVDHVDIVGLVELGDEPDGFRIGHGAREGLRKAGNAGELNDTGLFMAVWSKVLGEVIERFLDRFHHLGHIPGVLGVIVNLGLDAVPLFTRHGVAGAHERVEI